MNDEKKLEKGCSNYHYYKQSTLPKISLVPSRVPGQSGGPISETSNQDARHPDVNHALPHFMIHT